MRGLAYKPNISEILYILLVPFYIINSVFYHGQTYVMSEQHGYEDKIGRSGKQSPNIDCNLHA